ncbi:MAG: hypothetical protein D6B27_03270 [Gammaproteobacteria bacterium]|nr:MAG: hypothetical protein D6B27_03270 [Gammaproteobacteria bacterium]
MLFILNKLCLAVRFVIVLSVLCAAFASGAYDLGPVHVHGFLSQGYILSSGNEYIDESDSGGSFDFTQAGVNFLYRPHKRVILFSQLLSRNFGDAYSNEKDISLDYLFASINVYSSAEHVFDVRLGRIKNAYGLLNNIRDIPFTHVGILSDQSLYNEYDRYLALYGDGILFDYKYKTRIGQFNVLTELARLSDSKKDMFATEEYLLPYIEDVDEILTKSLQFIYTSSDGSIKLAYSNNIFDDRKTEIRNMPKALSPLSSSLPSLITHLDVNQMDYAENHILSMKYSQSSYSIMAEYMKRKIESEYSAFGLSSILPDPVALPSVKQELKSESYYLQGAYRFNFELEGFVGYHSSSRTIDGEKINYIPYDDYRKEIVVGVDWEFIENLMLKGEVHFVNGTYEILREPGVNSEGDIERKWKIFLLQLSYKF